MTAISVDSKSPVGTASKLNKSKIQKTKELATISELLIECNNGKRLSIHEEPEEEKLPGVDYSVISPEDLEDHKRAMESMKTGEYYTMLPGESLDDFLDRIESDPEGWLECNLKNRG